MKLKLDANSIKKIASIQSLENNLLWAIAEGAVLKLQGELLNATLVSANYLETLDIARTKLNFDLGTRMDTLLKTYSTVNEQVLIDETARVQGTDKWEYVGPLDQVTRESCQDALTIKYFTTEEKDAWNAETGLRYNCRHIFESRTDKEYEDGIK